MYICRTFRIREKVLTFRISNYCTVPRICPSPGRPRFIFYAVYRFELCFLHPNPHFLGQFEPLFLDTIFLKCGPPLYLSYVAPGTRYKRAYVVFTVHFSSFYPTSITSTWGWPSPFLHPAEIQIMWSDNYDFGKHKTKQDFPSSCRNP